MRAVRLWACWLQLWVPKGFNVGAASETGTFIYIQADNAFGTKRAFFFLLKLELEIGFRYYALNSIHTNSELKSLYSEAGYTVCIFKLAHRIHYWPQLREARRCNNIIYVKMLCTS